MKTTIVVAMTPPPTRLIGRAGSLPWHYSEDLKFFKATTLGHTIIMGRKTLESIKKALPGRRNLVISRTPPTPDSPNAIPGVEWFTSLEAALASAQAAGESDCIICGGAEIYRHALSSGLVDRMVITFVHPHPEPTGDTYFPAWKDADWRETSRQKGADPALEFVTYERQF